MTNWQEVRLGDVCIQITDGTHNTVKDCENGDCYLLSCKNIKNGNIEIGKNERKIDRHTLEELRKRTKTAKGDVLLSSVGTIGETAVIKLENPNYEFQRSVAIFKPNLNFITSEFLYYSLNSRKDILQHSAEGAVQQCLFINPLKDFSISLPPLDIQNKIAGVLGALDDKIKLNNKINNNLEQQMYALVEQDIWNIETKISLDEFCNVFTGRKNANEFEKNGVNKFFTCGPEALTINSFIYDGPAIIVSGNGAYTGRTRFYNGKFDLYQRTYACTIKENIKSDYIYILYPILKLQLEKKLMGGTHGSAIPYIVMNDIAKFQVPFNERVFNKIAPMCKAMIDKIQANEAENEKLSALRDTLLPELMSGEIDVSKVDISGLSFADKLSFTDE